MKNSVTQLRNRKKKRNLENVQRSASCVYLEVGFVEVVRNVPADLAVLASLLHHGVEEGQHVDQAAEGRVRAAHQRLQRDLKVRGSHVQLQPVGRLRHHLNRSITIDIYHKAALQTSGWRFRPLVNNL